MKKMTGRENEKTILIIVAVLAVIVLGVFFLMMGGYGGGGMMGGMMGPGMMGWTGMGFGWMMLIGPVFAVLFIVLIVYGIYYIFSGRSFFEPQRSRPLDILKERYARGDITEEQYTKMKKELES